MLRFKTKVSGFYKINEGEAQETEQPLYNHRIKEVINHLPCGGYISLISAYTPLRPFHNIGQIKVTEITATDHGPARKTLLFFDNKPINNLFDLISHLNNNRVITAFDAETGFSVRVVPASTNVPTKFELSLSYTAAVGLGFKKTLYTASINETICSELNPPPITATSLQILCHNVCGNSDSNMTFPQTIGIMHLVNDLSIVNPHIAVNHRLERGRVLDIEILDQNNRPFRWAPVYLELFVSESAEHEKRQGFFRILPNQPIIFNEELKHLSIADIYAPSFLTRFFNKNNTVVQVEATKNNQPFSQSCRISVLLTYDDTVLTRASILSLIINLNQQLQSMTGLNIVFVQGRIHRGSLELLTFAKSLTITNSFFDLIALDRNPGESLVLHHKVPVRLTINPNMFYNEDEVIEIYCTQFHTKEPLAVGRRIGNSFRIVNRNFWTWSQLEKSTNVLSFFYRVITYFTHDEKAITNKLPPSSDLIIKLFYK